MRRGCSALLPLLGGSWRGQVVLQGNFGSVEGWWPQRLAGNDGDFPMFSWERDPGQKCPGTGTAGGGSSASPAPRGPGCPPGSITAWNWESLSLLSQGLAITLPSQGQSAPSAPCIPKEPVVTFWLLGGAAGTEKPRGATLGPSPLSRAAGWAARWETAGSSGICCFSSSLSLHLLFPL